MPTITEALPYLVDNNLKSYLQSAKSVDNKNISVKGYSETINFERFAQHFLENSSSSSNLNYLVQFAVEKRLKDKKMFKIFEKYQGGRETFFNAYIERDIRGAFSLYQSLEDKSGISSRVFVDKAMENAKFGNYNFLVTHVDELGLTIEDLSHIKGGVKAKLVSNAVKKAKEGDFEPLIEICEKVDLDEKGQEKIREFLLNCQSRNRYQKVFAENPDDQLVKKNELIQNYFSVLDFSSQTVFISHKERLFSFGINIFLFKKLETLCLGEEHKIYLAAFLIKRLPHLFFKYRTDKNFDDYIVSKALKEVLSHFPFLPASTLRIIFYQIDWLQLDKKNPLCNVLPRFQEAIPKVFLEDGRLVLKYTELLEGWEDADFFQVMKGMIEREGVLSDLSLDEKVEIVNKLAKVDLGFVAKYIHLFELPEEELQKLIPAVPFSITDSLRENYPNLVNQFKQDTPSTLEFVKAILVFDFFCKAIEHLKACDFTGESWYALYEDYSKGKKINRSELHYFKPETWPKEKQQEVFKIFFSKGRGHLVKLLFFPFISKDIKTQYALAFLKNEKQRKLYIKDEWVPQLKEHFQPSKEFFDALLPHLAFSWPSDFIDFIFPFATFDEIKQIVNSRRGIDPKECLNLLIKTSKEFKKTDFYREVMTDLVKDDELKEDLIKYKNEIGEEILTPEIQTRFFLQELTAIAEENGHKSKEELLLNLPNYHLELESETFGLEFLNIVELPNFLNFHLDFFESLLRSLYRKLPKTVRIELFSKIFNYIEEIETFCFFEDCSEEEKLLIIEKTAPKTSYLGNKLFRTLQGLEFEKTSSKFQIGKQLLEARDSGYRDFLLEFLEDLEGEEAFEITNLACRNKHFVIYMMDHTWFSKLKDVSTSKLIDLFYDFLKTSYHTPSLLEKFPISSFVDSKKAKKAFYQFADIHPKKALEICPYLLTDSNERDFFIKKRYASFFEKESLERKEWKYYLMLPAPYQERYRHLVKRDEENYSRYFFSQNFSSFQMLQSEIQDTFGKFEADAIKDLRHDTWFNFKIEDCFKRLSFSDAFDLWLQLKKLGFRFSFSKIFQSDPKLSRELFLKCREKIENGNFRNKSIYIFYLQQATEECSEKEMYEIFEEVLKTGSDRQINTLLERMKNEFLWKAPNHDLLADKILAICPSKLDPDFLSKWNLSNEKKKEIALQCACKGYLHKEFIDDDLFNEKEKKQIFESILKLDQKAWPSEMEVMKGWGFKLSPQQSAALFEREGKNSEGKWLLDTIHEFLPFLEFECLEAAEEFAKKLYLGIKKNLTGPSAYLPKYFDFLLPFFDMEIVEKWLKELIRSPEHLIPHLEKMIPYLGRPEVLSLVYRCFKVEDQHQLSNFPFLTAKEKEELPQKMSGYLIT